MTTDVKEAEAIVADEAWDDDPSNPAPAMEFASELEEATLVISAYIDLKTNTVRPSYGAENDERILKQCQNYAEKSGGYSYTLWFLEAEGISVVLSTGAPFRVSDIIKLRSKKGDKLGANQAHALLAKKFEEQGCNASFTATQSPDTAVGRRFHFVGTKLASGTDKKALEFAKPVKLVPVKMFEADEHFEGEVRVVTPKSAEGEGPEANGPVSLPEAEVIAIIQEVLTGKTPGQMLNTLIDEPRLTTVPTVFGVGLLDAATDESLVAVLRENGCMDVATDGTLQVI